MGAIASGVLVEMTGQIPTRNIGSDGEGVPGDADSVLSFTAFAAA